MNRDRPREPKLGENESGISKRGAGAEGLSTRDTGRDFLNAPEKARLYSSSTPDAENIVVSPSLTPVTGPIEALTHMARMSGLLAPGSTFGVYVVGECIGEGGMARIYRAEHNGLRRQVALKVLINGFARDAEGRERFVREARIAAAIKHPNVVNIFDVGVYEDIPYLVMELLEGTDLESLVQAKGALDENLIIDIMVPVVAGLTAVHDAGIVHRDLKPGNIFLSRGRYEEIEPKLLDFGISKGAGQDPLKLTSNGLLLGTPFYMPPEGLRGDEMTPASDQYSLAVVMYECATGHAPFAASTFPELMKLITEGKYTPPNVHKPELSKRLARIITRAMSLDPEKRFKDLREMGRELLLLAGQRTRITWGLSFGDTSHAAAELAKPPDSTADGSQAESRRWRKPIVLAAAMLVPAFAGLGVLSYLSSDENAEKAEVLPPKPTAVLEPARVAEPAAPAEAPKKLDEKPALPAPEVVPIPNPPAPRSVHRATTARSTVRGIHAATAATADSEPEWALPVAPATSKANAAEATKPASGANGAPIFD
jgi:serine/threonine-protein kinase